MVLAAVLVAIATTGGLAQDNATQIITRDPREVTVAVNEWTTVAVINPHDGFGRTYDTPTCAGMQVWSAAARECVDPPDAVPSDFTDKRSCIDTGGYVWHEGECLNECPGSLSWVSNTEECSTVHGTYTLMLSLTGFPELAVRNGKWAIQAAAYDYAGKEIRVRVRKYDHLNASPSMFDQEGNFVGNTIYALCHDPGGDWDNDPRGGPDGHRFGYEDFGDCSHHSADWPTATQWHKHQKIKYWERTGGDPDTTYYVEGPFLVQVLVENGCYLEGVIRIQYDGYTNVAGGDDRRQVIEYSEVVVRGSGPAPNY